MKARGRMKEFIISFLLMLFGTVTLVSVAIAIFSLADMKTQYAENIVILEELCSIKPDYHYCKRLKGANQ